MAEFKIGRLRFTWKGAWAPQTFYNRDAVVQHEGKTYVCLVAHTANDFYAELNYYTQSGAFTPYWTLMINGSSWKGAYNSGTYYSLGNLVTYGGTLYQCTEPHTAPVTLDDTKWAVGLTASSFTGAWSTSVAYGVGDQVRYGGNVYRCTTNHVSAATEALGLESQSSYWALAYNGVDYTGAWQAATRYKLNDVVKESGSLWIATTGHTSGSAFDDLNWNLWVPGESYKDLWSSTTTYDLGDVVKYGGYSYISEVSENINNVPSVISASWTLVTIGYKFRGTWGNIAQYRVGDVVRRGGRLYTAIADSQGLDPSGGLVSTSYVAAGSSGTTVVVNDTTGIVPGMSIIGNGFSQRQSVTTVVDLTTITVSAGPNETPADGGPLRFTGIDAEHWKFVNTGTSWKNRWQSSINYSMGDLVLWKNITYICVSNHISSNIISPQNDTNKEYWQVYLYHARKNALVADGDLLTFNNEQNEAVSIGLETQVLQATNGLPAWKEINIVPKVFYVTTTGVDDLEHGLTWDKPWASIKYACDYILQGFNYRNSSELLLQNRAYIQAEIWNWIVYQIAQGNTPFTVDPNLDELKTKRDVGYILDAIAYDMRRSGNSQTVAATRAYFAEEPGEKFITATVTAQMPYFVAAVNELTNQITNVLNNSSAPTSYQTLNGISPSSQVLQVVDSQASPENGSLLEATSLLDIVITALTNQDKDALPYSNIGITATVMVKTGTYFENNPIVVPANTAIVGDELRGAVVRPANVVNTLALHTDSNTDRIQLLSYENVEVGTPLQFVGTALTMMGGLTSGQTYYVIDKDILLGGVIVSETLNGPAVSLTDANGEMAVYGGGAIKDLFLVRDATGLRNMSFTGLLGTLTEVNQFLTRRPTGAAYVAFDPGTGPDDSSAWIIRRSPYVQNVTTFGKGCVGAKIDGTIHNGGLHSMVANDFTQILSDGIGVWCTGPNSLTELVSVFAYYGYAGYMAEDGARIRATNGNTSYGTYGVIAEGYDFTETPVTGSVYNRSTQVQASVQSSFGQNAQLVSLNYSNAGIGYNSTTTNLIKYSNQFDNISYWTTSSATLQENLLAPSGYAEGWTITGLSSLANSDYLQQGISIQPAGAVYTNVSASNITGSGIGATFDITITSTGYTVAVNNGGSGYVAGNQLNISGSVLGGANNTNDCVITVQTLSGSAILTVSNTGAVPAGSDQNYTLSIYAKKGTAPSFDLQGIFSGTSTKGGGINYNFDTDTFTPYAISSGFTPVHYGRTPLENGWYRVWFAVNDVTAQNNTLTYKLYPRSTTGAASYNYFYGSQIETSGSTYAPSFYLQTETRITSSYANFQVVGSGSGAELVGDELRSGAVFQSRVTDPGSGAGGSGYLTASNASQLGDPTYIQIAASDTKKESEYIGMRVFINSGTGAGQYGYISAFDEVNKYAQVLKESFDALTITTSNASTDAFTISSGNTTNLYVGQMVQFLPTAYTTNISSVAIDQIVVTGTLGGTVNTFTVSSTKRLRRNMTVTFSGLLYGGVTSNYTYYITDILSDTTFQISTNFGGTTWQLLTGTPGLSPMYLNFPTNDSYINGVTTNMTPNMPIQFTGTSVGGISVGTTYYVNDVIDAATFSIANNLVTDTATDTNTTTDEITIGDTSTLTVFNPVVFGGTTIGGLVEGQKYYISKIVNSTNFQIVSSLITTTARASEIGSNLITVDSTTGFIPNNPIIFIGTAFGDFLTEKIYYILAVNDATSFTISATPGGSAVNLTSATGEITVKTTPAALNLTTDTGGTMTVTTTAIKKSLTAGYGSMIGTYRTEVFGNVARGTTYYIKSINAGANQFTISDSNGGPTFALSGKSGSMVMGEVGWDHINPGTPIENVLDSSSVYYIEPRTTFSDPSFSQTAFTSGVSLAPGTSWKASAYGKNSWMAIPDGNSTGAYSTDGTNWTSISLPGNYLWQDIAYGDGTWVIISAGGTGNSKAYYSRSNGQGWRLGNLPSATTWVSVAYGNGVFVAIASGGTSAAYSTNYGASWSSASGLPSGTWKSVTYGNGIFVAVASGGTTAAYSTDGITWVSSTLPASSNWASIAYGKGRFIAVSSSSAYPAFTFDGITWYQSEIPVTATSVVYGQGVFLALNTSNTTGYTSEDGEHWKQRTVSSSAYGAVSFGYATTTYLGKFVTLSGQNTGSIISAGCRAKGRAVITSGIITSVVMFEPGSGYSSAPTVTFTDPNVTTLATVTPRIGNGTLGNPTFVNRGTNYNTTSTFVTITGNGYSDSYQTGLTIILKDLTKLPQPGDNLVISGVTQIFKVTSATAKFGTTAPNIEANVQIAPELKVADSPGEGTTVTIRQKYSQVRLTGHDFLNVGYGNIEQSNYPGLPEDTVLAPQDQAVEVNYGRVFYTSTDQDGNFKVGSLFAVEQATGIITLSASQFGLSGLETLSLGGIAVGGQSVVIRQFSTDPTFVANSNEIIPTQKAIKSYLTGRLSQGGSNTFTGQLTAGTVVIGGADKIASTIPEGTTGSNVKMVNKVNVTGALAGWGGDGAALAYFTKSWHHR